jgi:hypothetical protein
MDLPFGESVLVESRYKIARAKEHDRVLYAEIRAFLGTQPYSFIEEFDDKQFTYFATLKITQPIPQVRLALIIGDCVHNLRSALDYIAWRLAGRNFADRSTLFPIYKTQIGFDTMVKRRHLDNLFHPSALDAIRDVQPYKRPQREPNQLWFLQELDARDKHKLLTMTQAQSFGGSIGAPGSEHIRVAYGAQNDGAILAAIRFPVGTQKSEVKVNFKPLLDVAFERGILEQDTGLPVNVHIPQIIYRVIEVVLQFERLITANPDWIR